MVEFFPFRIYLKLRFSDHDCVSILLLRRVIHGTKVLVNFRDSRKVKTSVELSQGAFLFGFISLSDEVYLQTI